MIPYDGTSMPFDSDNLWAHYGGQAIEDALGRELPEFLGYHQITRAREPPEPLKWVGCPKMT